MSTIMRVIGVGSTTTPYPAKVGGSQTTSSGTPTAAHAQVTDSSSIAVIYEVPKNVGSTASSTPSTSRMSSSSTPSSSRMSSSNTPSASRTSSSNTPSASRMSSSNTPSASRTSSSSTPSASRTLSASTTPYPYLPHLGNEDQKRIEQILVKLGFDDKEDGDYLKALNEFKKFFGMEHYSIYNKAVVNALDQVNRLTEDKNLFQKLKTLGFYNDKYDERSEKKHIAAFTNGKLTNSVYADRVPGDRSQVLKNFCQVYGISWNGESLEQVKKKVNEVYDYYREIYNNSKTESLLKKLGAGSLMQQKNFCKSLTFLKLGMGYSDKLAAAVLANWYSEGAFSETNKQDAYAGEGFDDSGKYTYKTNDRIGFGIMQWTLKERKEGLLDMAKSMASSVGNINVQFATFQKEIGKKGICESAWKNVKNEKTVRDYTITYMVEMENPRDKSMAAKNARVSVANRIYKAIRGMIETKKK